MIILAVAAISFTISVTSVFKSVRTKLGEISPFLEELIHCPYCLSHYVTLFFFVFLPFEGIIPAIIDYFAVIGGVAIVHYVMLRAYEPIYKSEAIRKIEKLNKK